MDSGNIRISLFAIIVLVSMILGICGCSPSEPSSSEESSSNVIISGDTNSIDEISSVETSDDTSVILTSENSVTGSGEISSDIIPSSSELSSNTISSSISQEEWENMVCTDAMIDRSIVSEGNQVRLAEAMKKALRGEELTIGYIGGSITQGAGASSAKSNYVWLVTSWWRNKFPGVKIQMVNAGIGATGSLIGVHRVRKDLLRYDPDVVVIEYAVNDLYDNENVRDAYESLIRRVMSHESSPAVLLMFMVDQTGNSVQDMQSSIGAHYDLPMISYKYAVWPEIQAGRLDWTDISPDFNHPNDHGHVIVSELLISYLEGIYKSLDDISADIPSLPAKLSDTQYINGEILTLTEITPVSSDGWSTSYSAFWAFSKGWISDQKGAKIIFEIESRTINLLYKEAVNQKGRKVRISVDGEEISELDSSFINGWGDFAEYYTVVKSTEKKKRTVEIEVISDAPEGVFDSTFTLLGIMVSE